MADINLIESSSYKISGTIDENQEKAKSGSSGFIGTVVLICVIGGAGLFLYKNYDKFLAIQNAKNDPNQLMRRHDKTQQNPTLQSRREMYFRSAVQKDMRFDEGLKHNRR
jgi:hypothetical protein